MFQKTKINISFDVEDIYGNQALLNDTLYEILSFCNSKKIIVDIYVSAIRYETLKEHKELMQILKESNYINVGYHSNSHSFATIPEQNSFDQLKKTEELCFDFKTEKFTENDGGILKFQDDLKTKLFRCPGFCWTPDYFSLMKMYNMKYTTIDIDYSLPFKFMDLIIIPTIMKSLEKMKTFQDFDNIVDGNYKSVYLHPARLIYNHFWDKLKNNTYHVLKSRDIYPDYKQRIQFVKDLLLYISQNYEIFSLTQLEFEEKMSMDIVSLKKQLSNSMTEKWRWSQITGNIDKDYHVSKLQKEFSTVNTGTAIVMRN